MSQARASKVNSLVLPRGSAPNHRNIFPNQVASLGSATEAQGRGTRRQQDKPRNGLHRRTMHVRRNCSVAAVGMSDALRGLRAALFIPDGTLDAEVAPEIAVLPSPLRLLVLWRWAAHIWTARTRRSRAAMQLANSTTLRSALCIWRAMLAASRRCRRLDVKAAFLRANSLKRSAMAVWRKASER